MVNSSKAWPPLDAQLQSQTAFELYFLESSDTLFGYAQSLADSGRILASLEVLAHIAQRLGATEMPIIQLAPVSLAILTSCIDSVATAQQRSPRRFNALAPMFSSRQAAKRPNHGESFATGFPISISTESIISPPSISSDTRISYDPLGCAICGDLLSHPITVQCGHTFCADCCVGQTQCTVCGRKFRPFKPDVLVGRLVEKWWSPEANQRAGQLLAGRRLDEALKACNESLDKCKW